ncbi:MAG: HNH endonuclease [Burkholderiales bacterium]|nr:HNH endonuclease [Anaerolineae bacterium]
MTRVPSAIREEVYRRANYRCEYCGIRDGIDLVEHQVDHIISQKHDGASTLDNLALACFWCNNSKGSDLAAYDDELLAPFFNPRHSDWDVHFEMDFETAIIFGKTPIGRVTVRILEMNKEERLLLRTRIINAGLW